MPPLAVQGGIPVSARPTGLAGLRHQGRHQNVKAEVPRLPPPVAQPSWSVHGLEF
ncbi:MAG: hypothetical protein LBP92_01880 [Deltaproteobacteria bacterium]|nr:hypothetical protein [Deltaproteobacteria bacterium]